MTPNKVIEKLDKIEIGKLTYELTYEIHAKKPRILIPEIPEIQKDPRKNPGNQKRSMRYYQIVPSWNFQLYHFPFLKLRMIACVIDYVPYGPVPEVRSVKIC